MLLETEELRIRVHEDNEDPLVLLVHLARKVIPVTTVRLDPPDHLVHMVAEVTLVRQALPAPRGLQALLAPPERTLQEPTGSMGYGMKRSSKRLNFLPSMEWKTLMEPGL